MSAQINDGGPAFPRNAPTGKVVKIPGGPDQHIFRYDPGMTLRDYFAGQALAGCLMNYTTTKFGFGEDDVAKCAYNYADAMIAESERRKKRD